VLEMDSAVEFNFVTHQLKRNSIISYLWHYSQDANQAILCENSYVKATEERSFQLMVIGDGNCINLSTQSFEKIMLEGYLYVDKSKFIEHFLAKRSDVEIIARQRRIGKSLNLDMLRCFLTSEKDYRGLFEKLYIRTSPVWEKAHSSPVFAFDFLGLGATLYKDQLRDIIIRLAAPYLAGKGEDDVDKMVYANWCNRGPEDATGLKLLTEIAYSVTGKRSYILIDEYDSLMMRATDTEIYDDMRIYLTDFLSNGLKGNPYLEKCLLTGVMRISHEDMLSGLNNAKTYEVFRDKVYASDYGLTEEEASELCSYADLDLSDVREWYNGVKISGVDIYNTFSVMNAIDNNEIDCYWGKSGTLDRIKSIITQVQKSEILMLLDSNNTLTTRINTRISPRMLKQGCDSSILYSLLIQAGYLSLDSWNSKTQIGVVSIPNLELKAVWRDFIFEGMLTDRKLNGFLVYLNDLGKLAKATEKFLTHLFDVFSNYDLPASEYKHPDGTSYLKAPELYYHHIVLSALTTIQADLGYKTILSNRESGDGRYDVYLDMGELSVDFEFKSGEKGRRPETLSRIAAEQVKDLRYGADLGKPVIAIGCGFVQKRVKVKCLRIEY
jgi:hypothetical protein